MCSRIPVVLLVTGFVLASGVGQVVAALSPEVRKELTELRNELRAVTGLVRRQKVDEAQAVIQQVDARLAELQIADDERDSSYTRLRRQLELAKAAIPVSFEADVAPILKDNCLRCHGANRASARLRMDTFNNMARGGQHGALAVPRNPGNSRILFKLTTTDVDQRMPKNGQPLSADDIATIGRWIAGGAEFDGESRDAEIGSSDGPKREPVKVVMANGSESVSFKEDVAPILVNICAGCHGGNNPRGGYSMATFESVLQGGDTGSTIVPGQPDASYIVDLTLRQDPLKMPAGQARLKRSQAQAIETWIAEGAHFDGGDPKAPLRSLVPTAADLESARLASMSDAEFEGRRIEQAATLWKRAAPREDARTASTDNLHLHGSVAQDRLDQFAEWGEQQVTSLTDKYNLPDATKPWRGRLIVFVTAERFDYEEFNTVLMNRRTPPSVSGHVNVTPNLDDAYVVLHDVGDTESAEALNAQQLLSSLLAQAYLQRDGSQLPDWLREGFGVTESGAPGNSAYLRSVPSKAATALSTLDSPGQMFDNGTFAPEDVAAVGYLLTRFLLNHGGEARFQRLLQALKTERSASRAVRQAYSQSPAALGQAFLRSGGK